MSQMSNITLEVYIFYLIVEIFSQISIIILGGEYNENKKTG